MPFCPQCRDEFEDEVEVCPDCRVALVPELPRKTVPAALVEKLHSEPQKLSDEPLVRVANPPNESIGIFWQGILEENGIKSMLGGSNFRSPYISSPSDSRLSIFVLESKAEEARALLEPFENDLKKPRRRYS